jgi:hypothetical protein
MTSGSQRHRRILLVLLALALGAGSLAAHDLFLKLTTYFLPPDTPVQALLLNGTFTTSENAVARRRIADFSLVGPSGRIALDSTAIVPRGDSTHLRFRTAGPGTYVMGLSVKPSEIALTGEQFNAYLKEEGIDAMLAERARTGALGRAAKERYAKHVKAIFLVGGAPTDQFGTVLGYPAEIVPLDNPYRLKVGDSIRVRCFVNGQATAGLTVLAGGTGARGARIAPVRATSDSTGTATLRLGTAGRWYLKFISMRPSTEGDLTHESQWATLTFQIR